MPTRRRRHHDPKNIEINLAPILNLVMILIPLLLLSVVFESMGVLSVDSPKLCACAVEDLHSGPSLPNPAVVELHPDSFKVQTTILLNPQDIPANCTQGDGWIQCTQPISRTPDALKSLRTYQRAYAKSRRRNDHNHAQNMMTYAIETYDWPALYNILISLKREVPEIEQINISAHHSLPFEFITYTMDLARHPRRSQHPSGHFISNKDLTKAPYSTDATNMRRTLFPYVTFSIPY